jgi:replicative DNA helicase
MKELTPYTLTNINLEARVLGACLEYSWAAEKVFSVLPLTAFTEYLNEAKIVYEMHMARKPIDITTVYEYSKAQKINHANWASFTNVSSNPANLKEHCYILQQYQLTRDLLNMHNKAIQDLLSGTSPYECLANAKNMLSEAVIAGGADSFTIQSIDTMGLISNTIKNGYKCFELPWKSYGNYRIEFEYTNLVIIAAEPSVGKTALMLNIAFHLSAKGEPVTIFNFESGVEKLKMRMLSMFSAIPLERIKRGLLNDSELVQVEQADRALSNYPIYLNENARDIISLEVAIRDLHSKGCKLFFVDNMSNVTLPQAERTDLRIGEYLQQLTRIKKDLGVTICILTHLSRENASNKSNLTSRLRNSGNYEQDADMILFLQNDETDYVKLICAKNRDGAKFETLLTFTKETQQFKDANSIEDAIFDVYNPYEMKLGNDDEIVF